MTLFRDILHSRNELQALLYSEGLMAKTNFSWDDLQLFLFVARGKGLAEASRETGVSAPTLSRRMERLEQALGNELFQRHARGYDLTPEGRTLLSHAEEIERRILEAEDNSLRTPGKEVVRISAGSWMSLYFTQNMSELQKPTDPFRLSLISAEHRLDIGRREAVIGLRNQKPTEPSLAVRKLGNYHFAAYAAPGCSNGWIGVCVDTRSARWTRSHFCDDILLEVSAPRNALDLARFGHGRVVLPCFIGDREPDLQRIGNPIEELEGEIWLVLNNGDRHKTGPRNIIDRIVALLAKDMSRFRGDISGELPSERSQE